MISEKESDLIEKIAALGSISESELLNLPLELVADRISALGNLSRWLQVTSSPGLQLSHCLESRLSLQRMLIVLGASQPIADSIIQNPEFSQLLESGEAERNLLRSDFRENLIEEGELLLKTSSSQQHGLDQLRYLKQRTFVQIVALDLNSSVLQSDLWRIISDTADALLHLCLVLSWEKFKESAQFQREVIVRPPFEILGFGKLGGRELNYSSDVDLVFVLRPEFERSSESELSQIYRFSQIFIKNLSEKMGRGFLYRVDMRLRPYGGGGALVTSRKGLESYYRNYAEPWEVLAFARTRLIGGFVENHEETFYDELKDRTCFTKNWSEATIDSLLEMRDLIDEHAPSQDFKRGRGGIRDIEFYTQIFQLLFGAKWPDLRGGSTLELLEKLKDRVYISDDIFIKLVNTYTFYRKLEHCCQLVGDLQTHELPKNPAALEHIEKLIGREYLSGHSLSQLLENSRGEVSAIYQSQARIWSENFSRERNSPTEFLPEELRPIFEGLPYKTDFYALMDSNEDSLNRILKCFRNAPKFFSISELSLQLLEQIISGEIEEILPRFQVPKSHAEPAILVAIQYQRWAVRRCIQWSIQMDNQLSEELSEAGKSLLSYVLRQKDPDQILSMICVGSFARQDVTLASDIDLIFLTKELENQAKSELIVQEFIKEVSGFQRFGLTLSIDLRLRPDGGKGLLARSYRGFEQYAHSDMESWERFALGQPCLLYGEESAVEWIETQITTQKFNYKDFKELVAMKRRIETERVSQAHAWRDIKLGRGGLGDIEWLVHLFEMVFEDQTKPGRRGNLVQRIQNLRKQNLITITEASELEEAFYFLIKLRHILVFHNVSDSIIPENPDKLVQLAESFGLKLGNDLLSIHDKIAHRTRDMYLEGLKRLDHAIN